MFKPLVQQISWKYILRLRHIRVDLHVVVYEYPVPYANGWFVSHQNLQQAALEFPGDAENNFEDKVVPGRNEIVIKGVRTMAIVYLS